MERYDFYLTGEIKGTKKEEMIQVSKNKMLYIVKKIKEEISQNFSKEQKIYICNRFCKKNSILKIFATLLSNTEYNKRDIDITYLIIVKEDYPNSPPYIFCLSLFNNNLDIFDMRNIQKNIIPEWSYEYNITDIILKLPSFTDSIDYQVSKQLIPCVGEYYLKSIIYDINDFLLNENNKFFRAKIVTKNKINDEFEFIQMYVIITKNNILFLKPVDKTNKSLCILKYIINLIGIERLRRFLKEGEQFKGLSCFKIVNNKYVNNSINTGIFNKIICVDEKNLIVKQMNEIINKRKEEINNSFKFFENAGNNDINEIEQIIGIKEELINNKIDDNIFYQIHLLYNKLIELSSNKDDESDFSIYVKRLQNFLDNYDKMKNEKNEKRIDDKSNNEEKINIEEKINNDYNFGF